MKPIRTFAVVPNFPRPSSACASWLTICAGPGTTKPLSCSAAWITNCGSQRAQSGGHAGEDRSVRLQAAAHGRGLPRPAGPRQQRLPMPTCRAPKPGSAAIMASNRTGRTVDRLFLRRIRPHRVAFHFRRRPGILAGDHLKSASDLGLPLVGVGLAVPEASFKQRLNSAGWQQEVLEDNDFA